MRWCRLSVCSKCSKQHWLSSAIAGNTSAEMSASLRMSSRNRIREKSWRFGQKRRWLIFRSMLLMIVIEELQQLKVCTFYIHFILMWKLVTHTHNCFTALFLGPPGWAGARRELLDFVVQGKINRGRHSNHPAGRHSIRTSQCPPSPSPHFLQAACSSCRPAKCQSTEGN